MPYHGSNCNLMATYYSAIGLILKPRQLLLSAAITTAKLQFEKGGVMAAKLD